MLLSKKIRNIEGGIIIFNLFLKFISFSLPFWQLKLWLLNYVHLMSLDSHGQDEVGLQLDMKKIVPFSRNIISDFPSRFPVFLKLHLTLKLVIDLYHFLEILFLIFQADSLFS
ncbi:hypothetical protein NE237_022745 [Protea cynaroides]|uniref:Uncharacterized protein n=1 Tax=Protea cynaroides TaxID=273540 RepID=A0A9Q0K4H9_9MAGN|nr:hypothetical protein NE237_022745 [Protea cynaroides]